MEDIIELYEDFQNGLDDLEDLHNENSNNENYRNNESEIYMNIDEICENLEESIKTLTPKIKKRNKMRIVEIRLKIHNYRDAKYKRENPKPFKKSTAHMYEFNSNNEDNNNSYRSVKKSKRRTARRGLSTLHRKPTFSSTRKSKSYRK